MNNVGRRALLGLTLAFATVAAWAAPVAAVDAADYLVWRWPAPGARGLGLVKTGAGTLQLEVIGLAANKAHTLVLSAAGCAKQSNSSNTLSTHSFNSDASGAKALSLELENALLSAKSARLFKGSTLQDCTQVSGQGSGDPIPTESISFNFYNRNGLHFAWMVAVENDETHWVGHDFMASEDYSFVATHATCPNQPTTNIVDGTWHAGPTGTIYQDQTDAGIAAGVIRSFQVFHGSTRVACSKAITASPVT